MTVHVTEHAIDRYLERVESRRLPGGQVDLADKWQREVARSAIAAAERAILTATAFGARIVRLGNGARLIITGLHRIRVVTVLGRDQIAQGGELLLSDRPICCGLCGMRCVHPIARACTKPECPVRRVNPRDATH